MNTEDIFNNMSTGQLNSQMSLLSSVEKEGDVVTEIITSITGVKKTFKGVLTKTIEQGQFTHFKLQDGRTIFVNDNNVLFIEIFSEKTAPY